MDRERVENKISELESEIERIEHYPEQYLDTQKRELNDTLQRVETKYEPEQDGNVTMYNHLRSLLQNIAVDEDAYLSQRKSALEDKIENLREKYELEA